VNNSCEIGVGEIGFPRKKVGYFVRLSVDPFAGESGFHPDQYICQSFDPVKGAKHLSWKVRLFIQSSTRSRRNLGDTLPEIRSSPTIEATNSRTFRVARFYK
jgi:hypothetical protein